MKRAHSLQRWDHRAPLIEEACSSPTLWSQIAIPTLLKKRETIKKGNRKLLEDIYIYFTYREVDSRGDDKSPVTAEVGIGNVGTEDGSHPHSAHPVGNVVCRLDRALVQLLCKVEHQV